MIDYADNRLDGRFDRLSVLCVIKDGIFAFQFRISH